VQLERAERLVDHRHADASGNPIVSGIPMVTVLILLEQYGYLGFGFQFVAQTDNSPDTVPTYDNRWVRRPSLRDHSMTTSSDEKRA
jgi:hypothetical protein